MQDEAEAIQPKEKVLAANFIMDSVPSFVLVISKLMQPQKDILNSKQDSEDGGDSKAADSAVQPQDQKPE